MFPPMQVSASLEIMLTASGIHTVLQQRVLPLLSIRDLASLTCTCVALRQLAHAEPELWRAGAAGLLPPAAALLAAADIATVKLGLKAYGKFRRALKYELPVGSVSVPGRRSLCISPDGRLLALLLFEGTVRDLYDDQANYTPGASVLRLSLEILSPFPGFCSPHRQVLVDKVSFMSNHGAVMAWSRDSKYVSLCYQLSTADCLFQQFDAWTGEQLVSFELPLGQNAALLSFSPDAQYLAVSQDSHAGRSVQVRDMWDHGRKAAEHAGRLVAWLSPQIWILQIPRPFGNWTLSLTRVVDALDGHVTWESEDTPGMDLSGHTISASGRYIHFSCPEPPFHSGAVVVDLHTARTWPLDSAGDASFSPDGTR